MQPYLTGIQAIDNGGRRRLGDRRILVSVPPGAERRAKWERRSGFDRRIRRVPEFSEERRQSGVRHSPQGDRM
ncbi:hypothetical protein [Desulfosarcina ovata]|uniref:Uncharacterized protein n=2 Tax=Desulfosarcina ovata TaxID=83564 RepID=A0A5K8A833_9BACT|nr:hypothetical protein [Desulfosarcina ovata]BBO81533.1 hypothetical protein DSCO28_20990 [Desulfosarcina ovata subsp. sediminis]BBO88792.1 hypothetical protein DSCOOX_19720 [Desulfosarcina ovata subsp. ovata]